MQHLPARLSHVHQQHALVEGVQGPQQALVLLHPHAPGEDWAGSVILYAGGAQSCQGLMCLCYEAGQQLPLWFVCGQL